MNLPKWKRNIKIYVYNYWDTDFTVTFAVKYVMCENVN